MAKEIVFLNFSYPIKSYLQNTVGTKSRARYSTSFATKFMLMKTSDFMLLSSCQPE